MSVEEQLEAWVTEAVELRFGTAGDPEGIIDPAYPGDSPQEVIHTLSRVRTRQDRIEEILTRIRRLRGRLSAQHQSAQLEADIRRDEAFQTNRATRVADFVTADERRADAALDSIQEKRAAFAAKRVADGATDAYYVVEGVRAGLSAYRQDLRAMLHAFTTVTNLEYSGRSS